MYTSIYTCLCTYTSVYTFICTCIVLVHTYVYMHMYIIHVHACVHACVHIPACTHSSTCIRMHVYMHVYTVIHSCIHSRACMCTHSYAHFHTVGVHTHTCTHAFICTCMCVYTSSVYMNVYMRYIVYHVYMFLQIRQKRYREFGRTMFGDVHEGRRSYARAQKPRDAMLYTLHYLVSHANIILCEKGVQQQAYVLHVSDRCACVVFVCANQPILHNAVNLCGHTERHSIIS